jgi:hypothetical protein
MMNPRVLFFADEGEQMLKLGKGDSSILLSILRTAWSGGALGQTNATRQNYPGMLLRTHIVSR